MEIEIEKKIDFHRIWLTIILYIKRKIIDIGVLYSKGILHKKKTTLTQS